MSTKDRSKEAEPRRWIDVVRLVGVSGDLLIAVVGWEHTGTIAFHTPQLLGAACWVARPSTTSPPISAGCGMAIDRCWVAWGSPAA